MTRKADALPRRGIVLLGVLLVALVSACGTSGQPAVPPPPASVGTSTDQPIPASVLGLPLVDYAGRPSSLAAFPGKVLVISDMMTLCQETCAMDTANLVATARVVDRAGLGDRIEFASITVDPQRDTPARLAAYRALFGAPPANWTLLTGAATSTDALWHDLGVYVQKAPEATPPAIDWMTGQPLTYDVTHADLIFFVDGAGHERFTLDGAGHLAPGTPLPATLRGFLDAQGLDNLDHPGADTWTVPQALQVVSWLTDHRVSG
jgi:protein SCO1/2